MNYKIVLEKSATKFIKKQDAEFQDRIIKAIKRLPEGTDIKKLKNTSLYRMRIGGCRILYSKDDDARIIVVKTIDSRGDIYKSI